MYGELKAILMINVLSNYDVQFIDPKSPEKGNRFRSFLSGYLEASVTQISIDERIDTSAIDRIVLIAQPIISFVTSRCVQQSFWKWSRFYCENCCILVTFPLLLPTGRPLPTKISTAMGFTSNPLSSSLFSGGPTLGTTTLVGYPRPLPRPILRAQGSWDSIDEKEDLVLLKCGLLELFPSILLKELSLHPTTPSDTSSRLGLTHFDLSAHVSGFNRGFPPGKSVGMKTGPRP